MNLYGQRSGVRGEDSCTALHITGCHCFIPCITPSSSLLNPPWSAVIVLENSWISIVSHSFSAYRWKQRLCSCCRSVCEGTVVPEALEVEAELSLSSSTCQCPDCALICLLLQAGRVPRPLTCLCRLEKVTPGSLGLGLKQGGEDCIPGPLRFRPLKERWVHIDCADSCSLSWDSCLVGLSPKI